MIVFTITAQRYAGGKPQGNAFTKRYCANGSALDVKGVDASEDEQRADEVVMTRGVGRKARELYCDLAHAMGIRRISWTIFR